MTQKLDTTKFVKFVGETAPGTLTELAHTILGLIAQEVSTNSRNLSAENRGVLQELQRDMADVKFESVIDLERPRFALTPQELEWLQRHEQSVWVDYLVQRYNFKLYPIQKKLSTFPPHLLIEPTPICNLRCIMCFQVDKSFSSNRQYMGMMSWDLFTSVVDQAAEHGCHSITLASRGEPTLHKQFGQMVMYLNEKGILDTKINTNAVRFPVRMIHDILAANVSTVTFSVDASTKETYERIRVKGKFERVLANIESFNKIRQTQYPKSGTTTRISGVAVEGTQNPEEMKRFWSDYVDHVAIVQEIPRWDSYGNLPFRQQTVCTFLYERLYVWFDGVCNPCDFDYKSLLSPGNATQESIADIWLSPKLQRLRELHKARERASTVPCDRCPF